MQGLQSLNQFKDFVSSIGGLGRYEDTYIVHAAEGETVVPMEVLDRNPLLKKRLFKTMVEMGIEPGRYIVGNELNSKNPVTGQPEFFIKKIGRRLRKAAADISGYAAPIAGALFGPAAGAATGALLGQYKRENPGDPTQGLNMALRGGLAGIASNIAGGQGILKGGLSEQYKLGDIFGKDGLSNIQKYLTDSKGKSNIMNKFRELTDFGGNLTGGEDDTGITSILETVEKSNALPKEDLEILKKAANAKKSGKFGNMSLGEIAKLYGLGTAGLGFLLDKTQSDGPVGMTLDEMPEGQVKQGIVNPLLKRAQGGVMDLQDGGESKGPGTGTSDSIPAMLSDGEFVMTAKAVRGAGGGDRREGAKKMYEAMDKLEARA
jgi:hypothetical protein